MNSAFRKNNWTVFATKIYFFINIGKITANGLCRKKVSQLCSINK